MFSSAIYLSPLDLGFPGKMGGTWLKNGIGIYCRNLFFHLLLRLIKKTIHRLELLPNIGCIFVRTWGPSPLYTPHVTHAEAGCCFSFPRGCSPVKCCAHTGIRETRLGSRIKPLSSWGALSKPHLQGTSMSLWSFLCFLWSDVSPMQETLTLHTAQITLLCIQWCLHLTLQFLLYAVLLFCTFSAKSITFLSSKY